MFVTLAPMRIPGQSRRPKISSAARAMPVGGHTSVANPATGLNVRPSFAATTYAAARTTIGIVLNCALLFTCRKTSRPSTFGILRSNSMSTGLPPLRSA
jgi:hypothetical protein